MVLPMARPLKHKKTGVYWYKARVPADLHEVVGKKMYSITLGTKDPVVAKQRFAEIVSQKIMEHQALRARPDAIPHRTIMEIAGEVYRALMGPLEDEPGEPEVWLKTLALLGRLEASGGLESWYWPTIKRRLSSRGLAADEQSGKRLIDEAHRAFKQAVEQQLRRAEGDYRSDPNADRFPIPHAQAPSPAITLKDLFDLWEREHLANNGSFRTIGDFKQKFDDFVAYLGHSDPNKVTPENVSDYCDVLKHERGLSGKTVKDKYLTAIRTVFRTALGKSKVKTDPTATIRVKTAKVIRERPAGFTDEEARAILKCSLGALEAPGKTSELNRIAYRWLPWICAYTGARAGEIAQLRREDLIVEYGITCVRITPEAGSVKTGQYRTVPLHPHLIEMGLPAFIASRPDGPLFYAPSNRPRKDGYTSAASVRGKVGTWVRQTVKITDSRIQPNHAWRHRFKTLARDIDIGEKYMDAIQGHNDGTASTDYGETTVKAMDREIRKMPRYDV